MSMTTRATPSPTNAAARRRLRRLTVDPPFQCAPALSSLPDTFLVTPFEISGNTLPPSSHRRATGEHATALSCARSARGDRAGTRAQQAAQAGCPAGLGCQAVAQPAFQPTVRGRPLHPVGSCLGPVSAWYCTGDFKCFPIVLNHRN
jgi:hypothetical protein